MIRCSIKSVFKHFVEQIVVKNRGTNVLQYLNYCFDILQHCHIYGRFYFYDTSHVYQYKFEFTNHVSHIMILYFYLFFIYILNNYANVQHLQ